MEAKRTLPLKQHLGAGKEREVASHASGRNSGVLHAGFYYTAHSLKAKLTARGNRLMKAFCHHHHLPVNACGKVVVAQREAEVPIIDLLHRRALTNGVETKIVDTKELRDIDPNAKTISKALYSPSTASVEPRAVCLKLKDELTAKGVHFF